MATNEKKFVPVMITPFNLKAKVDLEAVSRLVDFYFTCTSAASSSGNVSFTFLLLAVSNKPAKKIVSVPTTIVMFVCIGFLRKA